MTKAEYQPGLMVRTRKREEVCFLRKTSHQRMMGRTISPEPYCKNKNYYYAEVLWENGTTSEIYINRLEIVNAADNN